MNHIPSKRKIGVLLIVFCFFLTGCNGDDSVQEEMGNTVVTEAPARSEAGEKPPESNPSKDLKFLEEILEDNHFENVTFQESENAICYYESYEKNPFEGYMIPVYKETSGKDILFECTFLVEKETGDIYTRGEKDWVLLKAGILAGLNLPDEPKVVLRHEDEMSDENDETVLELLDMLSDFLKTEEEYANFKIKYDGVYSFLGRKYRCVSLYEDINDDMIHTLQRYYVDMETGNLYQESDHIITGERMELYYMGNLEEDKTYSETWIKEHVTEVESGLDTWLGKYCYI